MLNRYPLWKNLLVFFFLFLGIIYALPNLYPDDFAVQVSGARSITAVDQTTLDRVVGALDKENIPYRNPQVAENAAMVRFDSNEDQLAANEVIKKALGEKYISALNLVSTTPEWLSGLGGSPMKLGLDLRGGVHFLMEVDTVKAVEQRMDVHLSAFKKRLREEKLRYQRDVELPVPSEMHFKFRKEEDREEALNLARRENPDFFAERLDANGDYVLKMALLESKVKEIEDYAITQNLVTLRNRVNALGVAEPLVQRQGRNRIVVELPGVQDTAGAKKLIGSTANLEFRLEAKPDAARASTESFEFRSAGRGDAILERDVIARGDSVANAQQNFDENGAPQVNITLDSVGGNLMNSVTRNAIKRRMGVLFVESKERTREVEEDGVKVEKKIRYEEKKIISLATIQSALGASFRITGLDSVAEARELALLLRAGALAAPIYFVEERTVGPSLGKENIEAGAKSVVIGFVLVLIFMIFYYRVFGIVANFALAANLILLCACMSLFGATLTLPGIAGIVLTVGMAVDANVLIYERVREEIRNGLPPQSAIHAGYDRAFISIFDANITTLIAALILFAVGTGPVQGFAITLSIGIITSMFTSIVGTRAVVNLIYGRRNVKSLSIGSVREA